MATFEEQVEALTSISIDGSSAPTTTELAEYLKDGVIDVTNRMLLLRPQDVEQYMRASSTTSTNGLDVGSAKIISVIREAGADGDSDGSTAWRECRKVPTHMRSRVVDQDSLYFASKYNPVYLINNNGAVNVYPVPDGTNDGFRVYYVNNEPKGDGVSDALAAGHTTIGFFPKDKVYLVILYASIKSLQSALSAVNISTFSLSASAPVSIPGNPSITGVSVGAVTIASLPTAPDYVSPTTTISGVAWATEYPSRITAISASLLLIKDAVDQAATAAGKFEATDADSIFGDESTFLTADSQLTYVKDALIKAQTLIDGATMGGDTEPESAQFWLNDEDTEMVQATLQTAQTEIQRAQAEIQHWTVMGDMRVKEIQAALQEADGYAKEVQAYLSATPVKIQEYQAKVQDALNEFNDANVVYQAGVQRNFQQAQLDMQDAMKEADIDLQEKIQDYTLELQRVSIDAQKYQALVAAEVQAYQQEIAEKSSEYQWQVARLQDLKLEYNQAFAIMAPKQAQSQQAQPQPRR